MNAAPRGPAIAFAVLLAGVLLDDAGRLPVDLVGVPLTAAKLGWAAVAAWIALTGRWRATLPRGVAAPLAAFFGVVTLSALASGAPADTLPRLLTVGSQALLAVTAALVVRDVRAPTTARTLLGLGTLAAWIGVLGVLPAAATTSNPVASVYTVRATGTFSDPVDWSAALLLVLPAGLVGCRTLRGRGLDAALAAGLSGLLLALLASRSRAGLLVLVPTAATLLALLRTRRTALLGAGLLLLPTTPVLTSIEGFRLRFGVLGDGEAERALGSGSVATRSALYAAAVDLFRDHPVLGVGPGRFPALTVDRHPGSRPHWPHSTPLGLLAETGLLGLSAALALALSPLGEARRRWPHTDPATRDLLTGLGLSALATATLSLTVDLWYRPLPWLMLGVTWGVLSPATQAVGGSGGGEAVDHVVP